MAVVAARTESIARYYITDAPRGRSRCAAPIARALTAAHAQAAQLGLFAVELSTQHNSATFFCGSAGSTRRAPSSSDAPRRSKRTAIDVSPAARVFLALVARILTDTPPVRAFARAVRARIRLARGLVADARAERRPRRARCSASSARWNKASRSYA
jgi:hypothetical protein